MKFTERLLREKTNEVLTDGDVRIMHRRMKAEEACLKIDSNNRIEKAYLSGVMAGLYGTIVYAVGYLFLLKKDI